MVAVPGAHLDKPWGSCLHAGTPAIPSECLALLDPPQLTLEFTLDLACCLVKNLRAPSSLGLSL